jgi:hypothetical protein
VVVWAQAARQPTDSDLRVVNPQDLLTSRNSAQRLCTSATPRQPTAKTANVPLRLLNAPVIGVPLEPPAGLTPR